MSALKQKRQPRTPLNDDIYTLHPETMVDSHTAARLMGCSLSAVLNARMQQRGPVYYKLGRNVLYKVSDILDFRNAGKVTPTYK